MTRINAFIAHNIGISRREADRHIEEGLVKVNGKKAKLGQQINPEKDTITLNERVIKEGVSKYTTIALYKPTKCVTTRNDPEKRKTVMSFLPPRFKSLKPIGRLDYLSEGLILFSDDGDLIYKLTHPKFEKEKEYILELKEDVTDNLIKRFLNGIRLTEGLAKADKVEKLSEKSIKVTLHQGYNRQLRRMTENCDNKVTRLTRIKMGDVELGNLHPGDWREI